MSDTDENHLIGERRAKLAKIRERGTAFPNDFRRNALAADLRHALLDGLEIRIGDDLLRGQHGGMGQRSLDIDEREAFVEEHR